jgi:hypothetical protein
MGTSSDIFGRRRLFNLGLHGLGATALLALLQQEAARGGDWHIQQAPKAKRAIQICLVGGLSHIDSFDHKPELEKFHGKSLQTDEQVDIFFGQMGLLRRADWPFKPRGQCGLMISELFPQIAELADDLTIIRSMESKSANHTPGLFLANSGFEFNGYPSMGSWISYGLGSMNESLPAYVVLNDERGAPNTGVSTWSSAFLPANHQGVVFKSGGQPVRDLFPDGRLSADTDRATHAFVTQLNREHAEALPDYTGLAERVISYELAASLQASIPAVSDLSQESAATLEAYGLHRPETSDMGRRCLLGRRLLEQGVRFVQLFSGGPIAGSPRASWDAHENVFENHSAEARRIDQPVAALLKDLKQRGLLNDTLVLFTTEFGRTPFAQSAADQVGPGRDHNRYGFSCWMAGAGLKSGTAFGATDELGWKAVQRPVPWHDLHATILHLLGLDHERLSYYHNGIQRRLTNVHGEVLHDILG